MPGYDQNTLPIPGVLYKVFTKDTWTTAEWTENTDLKLIDIRDGANRVTEARFLYHCGEVIKRGANTATTVAPLALSVWRKKFIKIEVYVNDDGDPGDVIERWIVRPERIDHKIIDPGSGAINQTIFCYGLELALDNKVITGTWIYGNTPDGTATAKSSRKFYALQGVQMRFNEPKFGSLSGLKNQDADYPSTVPETVTLYNVDTAAAQTVATAYTATSIALAAFAMEKDATRYFWTIGEALQYLFTFYGVDLTNETFYPKNTAGLFRLEGLDILRQGTAFADSVLKTITGDFDEDGSGNRAGLRCPSFSPEGRTLFECLNFILRPERGLGWKLVYDSAADEGSRGPKIVIFTITTTATPVGDTVLQPSLCKQNMDLTGRYDVANVRVLLTNDNNYGYIIAQGAPILSCFPLCSAEGSLDRGWLDADETIYNNPPGAAVLGTDGYWDKLADARRNMKAYSEFIVKDDWNWKCKNGENSGTAWCVNPAGPSNTTGLMPTDPTLERNVSRVTRHVRFESFIPIEDVHFDHVGEELVPEYLRPKVFGKWTNSLGQIGWYDLGTTTTTDAPQADISALSDKLGFKILCTPPHRLAVTPPSNRDTANEKWAQTKWNEMIVVAAMRTTQRLNRAYQITDGDKHKILWIDVPNAELWIVAPNTPYGVNGNRELIRTSSDPAKRAVRNDGPRLGEIVGMAGAWYSEPHRDIEVQFSSLPFAFKTGSTTTPNWEVGVVIELLVWGSMSVSVYTAVSGRYFNFQANESAYITGFGRPDFAILGQ